MPLSPRAALRLHGVIHIQVLQIIVTINNCLFIRFIEQVCQCKKCSYPVSLVSQYFIYCKVNRGITVILGRIERPINRFLITCFGVVFRINNRCIEMTGTKLYRTVAKSWAMPACIVVFVKWYLESNVLSPLLMQSKERVTNLRPKKGVEICHLWFFCTFAVLL